MTLVEVLMQMESMATPNAKQKSIRHGAKEPLFGVTFADLEKLRKQTKTDHALALELWGTRNYDARLLATMIADSKQMDETTADRWVREIDVYVLTDLVSGLVHKCPFAKVKAIEWAGSDEEWVGRVGYLLLARLAADGGLTDAECRELLSDAEANLQSRKNRVRDAMNMLVISIGIRTPELEADAIKVAKTIGKVHVDHGDTACVTPDAAEYIRKTIARKGYAMKSS